MGGLTEDPFGTAQIRQRVLDAWAASPARFREDANAEEDLVLGGYRDRLLIELAQNAADAATAAGVPGWLRLTLDDDELRAANVGAPLDADGVQGLATLRASAKQGSESIGRYGVGFAAVLAVSDEPSVVSRNGGVRFSATDTSAAVADIPSLTGEVQRRSTAARGAVPILRLPFPVAASRESPPPGYDTEVRLPLRDGARDLVQSLLQEVNADVLLGLPGLSRLELNGRVMLRATDGQDVLLQDGDRRQRWRVNSVSGELPPELLAGRPIEEQERSQWTVSWAVPIEDGLPVPLSVPQVVHAPTPSDEPLSLPLRLIATYPLAPDRRHIAAGPVTAHLNAAAARAFGELILSLPADPAVLAMLPRPGLAGARLDADVCAAVGAELRGIAWLPEAPANAPAAVTAGASTDVSRVRPDRATALDPASDDLVNLLADVMGGLLPALWSRRSDAPTLTSLGVQRMDLAAVIDLVSSIDRPARWWGRFYAALERTDSLDDRDALSAIPVPLADGRMAYGARGVLLAERDLERVELAALGLRVVDADAISSDDSRRFLERLGATPATAIGILTSPAIRAAVEASYEEEDPDPIARAVLSLVRAAGVNAGTHPWLADLALPDSEGRWAPAGELVLPGSRFAEILEPGALGLVDPDLVEAFGAQPLVSVGVLDGFAVLRAESHEIGEDEHDLDAENRWYESVFDQLPQSRMPPVLTGLVAVRDLDLVRPDRWSTALELLAGLPGDVFADAMVTVDAVPIAVPSYTRWWLSTHPVLDGQRPDRLREADAEELAGLFDAADVPPALVGVVRCLTTIQAALADVDSALELLDRLGRPERTLGTAVLADIYPRLAVALDGIDVQPPARVRVSAEMTVDRNEAVVLDEPHLLPLLNRTPVPAPGFAAAVADLLDLPLASELVTAVVTSRPTSVLDWADVPGAAAAARRLGLQSIPGRVGFHDRLVVTGDSDVPWWPQDGVDHVHTGAGPDALGRALSWRHSAWSLRTSLAEAFARPDDAARLAAEDGAG